MEILPFAILDYFFIEILLALLIVISFLYHDLNFLTRWSDQKTWMKYIVFLKNLFC